jgi:segregation and condensation protein A
MAATLMSIKSRSLLPRDDVDLETDLDPRDELIQRLIEYRRFKEASDSLGSRYEERALQHSRGAREDGMKDVEPALDLGELTCWDLLAAFSRLMRETLANRPHRVTTDPRPLRFYVHELAHTIRERGDVTLRELLFALDETPSRESLVGSFCALLELVKLGLVGVAQEGRTGEISIQLKPEHAIDIEEVVDASLFDDELPESTASETEAAPSPA